MMTPQTARPAPHIAASSVRGSRNSQTIPSRMALIVDSPTPSLSKITEYTSATDRSAGPIVTVTATDSASTTRPTAVTTAAIGTRSFSTDRTSASVTISCEVPSAQRVGDLLDAVDGADRRVHVCAVDDDVALVPHGGQPLRDRIRLEEGDLAVEGVTFDTAATQVSEDEGGRVAIEDGFPAHLRPLVGGVGEHVLGTDRGGDDAGGTAATRDVGGVLVSANQNASVTSVASIAPAAVS